MNVPVSLLIARKELSKYSGTPMCQDCKWKLGTDITDNCWCCCEMTPERERKRNAAFNRARELQAFIAANDGTQRPNVENQ